MSKREPTAVCVLSPHPLVLRYLEQRLPRTGFKLCSYRIEEAGGGRWRAESVPTASLYVLDGHALRPGLGELVSEISKRRPSSRVLVLAEGFKEGSAFPLLRQGVKGLLAYSDLDRQLNDALRTVAGGGFWVSRALLSRFVDTILTSESGRQARGAAELSVREREVLDGLLDNLSNKEIAARLHISERTAKFHVANLLAKFNVRRRSDLILQHWQAGRTLH